MKNRQMNGKTSAILRRGGAIAFALAVLCGCGSGGDKSKSFPADFNERGDAYRVAWMMEHAAPDSVARFICYAALGQVDGARIDTLSTATLYAYENYRDSDAVRFGDEYDRVVGSMNLENKMKMYVLGGSEDPQTLGYKLGLEYMSHIRDNRLTPDQVEKELKAFRRACGNDSSTYHRFVIGFKTVLRADSGSDVSKDIYDRFIKLDEYGN